MSTESVDQNTLPPSQDPADAQHVVDPPRDAWGILRKLGPGLIIAASIVGSGELIGTTKTGAQAGMVLLWLILIGCIIKVFVQVELGRYTLSEGESTLSALNSLPGPRWRVSWLVWYWCLMLTASLGQLGGIVGGVGQSLAITFPITGDYLTAIRAPSQTDLQKYLAWEDDAQSGGENLSALPPAQQERVRKSQEWIAGQLAALPAGGAALIDDVRSGKVRSDPTTKDDRLWAALVAVLTSILLGVGRYRMIQDVATVLVVLFTFVTIGNVFALQSIPDWRITPDELWAGLQFRLPEGGQAVATALAVFGIIGVGASELVAYPYWCLEKGYARYAGRKSDDPAWAARAKGWIRVMIIDAFVSMAVYTVATLAFYVMGAAVLHGAGRDPEGMRMVTTLAFAYEPVFGEYAKWLFLLGAVAVLYSTYLVANAGNARMMLDALKLFGAVDKTRQDAHDRWLRRISIGLPLFCLAVFVAGGDPVSLVLFSGMLQALMLPMLAGAALYFRYTRTDPRLRPSPLWDLCLAISSLGMLVAGLWGANVNISKFVRELAGWFG
jgi:Mn2+/Fe2+ NRAMP family transporter